MTTKRVFIGAWLAGAAASAILTFGEGATWSMMAPTDLLRWLVFWPLLVLESVGSNACVHGCSGLTFFLAEDLDALFPPSLLGTLTFPIVCALLAWGIVRWLRPKRRRMFR